MNWIWQELQIEATKDPMAIRKAYAKRLKQIDADVDVDAFQRLRAALEAAQSLAAGEEAPKYTQSEILRMNEAAIQDPNFADVFDPRSDAGNAGSQLAERVRVEIREIYTELRVAGGAAARDRAEEAIANLQSEGLDATLLFEQEMVLRLYKSRAAMPMDLVGFLIKRFDWTEQAPDEDIVKDYITEIVRAYRFWYAREEAQNRPDPAPAPSEAQQAPRLRSRLMAFVPGVLVLLLLSFFIGSICTAYLQFRDPEDGNPHVRAPEVIRPSGGFTDDFNKLPRKPPGDF